jgi:hypothetical protein
MKRQPLMLYAALPAALLLTLVACEAKKSSNPLSPSVAGPIAGVDISPPKLAEPAQGVKFKENQQPIKLTIENSNSTGVRPLSYLFEVATDSGFSTKVFARSGVLPGEGGRTSVQLDTLELGRTYYWRAKADDGANASEYTSSQFEMLPRAVLTVPALVSPVNNDLVTTSRPTLRIRNSEHNAAVGAVSYFFVVARDQAMTQIVATGMIGESGTTAFVVDRDLEYNATHFWRVRASDGEVTTDWSATQVFRTSASPAPGPAPGGPAPGGGGSCASRDGQFIVHCVAEKYSEYRRAGVSSDRRRANMEFLRDRIIEAGVCGGLQLGWNLKRGGPELSIDFIAERRGNQTIGYDIAFDYDNTSTVLQLQWASDGPGSHFKALPNPNCNR